MKQLRLHSYLFNIVSEFNSGKALRISCFPIDLLLSLQPLLDKPVAVILPDNRFEETVKRVESLFKSDNVLFIPSPLGSSDFPPGFKLPFQNHINSAKNRLKTGINNVHLIFTTERGLHAPLVGSGVIRDYSVGVNSDFESFVGFLTANEYQLVDYVVLAGQFAKRGGIIDVHPKNFEQTYRINFLDIIPSIFTIDTDTQLTTNRVNSLFISTAISSKLEPLALHLKDNFIKITIDKNDNLLLGGEPYHDLIFPLKHISFKEFRKNKISIKSTYHCKELVSCGLIDENKNLFIPSWFTKKAESVSFKRTEKMQPSLDMTNLRKGDYLVHRDHGVGEYRGLQTFEDDTNGLQEFLLIKYADSGLVSVSLSKMDLLWYFAAAEERVHTDALANQAKWFRKKKSAQKKAEEVVDQLLSLYANRSDALRPPFNSDDNLESQFLKDFPFEETIDQNAAWDEISADFSSSTPMDRLLCGDVGFGKTEIAIRAAFRVVLGGKRVVVLAPTTILANQLFGAISARLSPFAVAVEIVSRFRSKGEINGIKKHIEDDKNDVLIGTHSILNSDIYLKNIGLLVVDEEHRFGVKQKEKIKHFKENIDVLSMSATPIPRSLNLALTGIYQISMLQTPPKLRLPIKTQVSYYDENIIKNAVKFEIERGGQVYFVHNDISSIEKMCYTLAGYFPQLNIDFLHGQEPPRVMEEKMRLFLSGAIDVLVCTSIIETGIDIPNVNCIIINRVHLFGLAQLYQMRGRVGRSHRQAHAYLLIPGGLKLSPKAYSRIKTVEENVRLGSGYTISKRDMELRGAGALFGYTQSGGVGDVGYEMYLRLVRSALNDSGKLKENYIIMPENVEIQVYTKRFIPESYIPPADLRVSFYKNLSTAADNKTLETIKYHLVNRFGPTPLPVENLLKEYELRLYASRAGVSLIKKQGCGIRVNIIPEVEQISKNKTITFIETFFKTKGINFHFLPTKNNNLIFCFHNNNENDNFSILTRFMNKLSALQKLN